jgi:Gpi18-like mannosyltransferase
MRIARILGTLVIFGVPVIVGGGIVYALTESFPAMFLFEIILAFAALGVAFRDGVKLG